jgi:hypothetical protein
MTDEVECKVLLPWKKELSRGYTDSVRLNLSQLNDGEIPSTICNLVYDFILEGDKFWHAIADGTYLGYFDTAEAARDAVDKALIELGYRLLSEDDKVMLLL